VAVPELIIFDFDGTLVDTAPDLVRATNLYLKAQGFAELEEARIRESIGMGLRRLILQVWPDHEVKDDALKTRIEQEFLALYEQEYLVSPTAYPGLLDFLAQWDRRIAIVSNKRRKFIAPILQKVGLDGLPWAALIGGDTYANMKPHPEPFLAAMEAAGVTPEQTLIIGDGFPDVTGALAVGSPCLAVEFGYTSAEELKALGAFASLASFEDLLPLVNSL
jgi:phosphoglycolate phosphatase